MTSLTTMLVLLPLTLGISESAQLRAPMEIAVISGLCRMVKILSRGLNALFCGK